MSTCKNNTSSQSNIVFVPIFVPINIDSNMATSILSALTKECVKQYVQQQLQTIIELQQKSTNMQSPPQQQNDLLSAVSSKYCFELDGEEKVEEENNYSPSFDTTGENEYLETPEHFENFTHILLNAIKKKSCEKMGLQEIEYSLSCSNTNTTTTLCETKQRVSCISSARQSRSSCSSSSSSSSGAWASLYCCCNAPRASSSCLRATECRLNCCFVHNSNENNYYVPEPVNPPKPPVPVSSVVVVVTVSNMCEMQASMCSSLSSLSLSLHLQLQHLLLHQSQLCFDHQWFFNSFDEGSDIISSDRSGKGFKGEGDKGSIIIINRGIDKSRERCGSVDTWHGNVWCFAGLTRKFNRRTTSTVFSVCALAAKAAVSAAPQAA